MTNRTFDTRDAFEAFLVAFPVSGDAFPKARFGVPYDVSFQELNAWETLVLTFSPFVDLYLQQHPTTYELFLTHVNTGGHGVQCRIVKFDLSTIYENAESLESWYADYGYRFTL